MAATSQEELLASDELQDPFDVDHLSESLRNKQENQADEDEMAEGCTTDRVLMIIQVSMFVLCVIAGLMVGLSLGWAVSANLMNCPLYAHIAITPDLQNKSVTIEEVASQWGSDSTCNYCTFSAVCIAIYAIIWIWFFVLTSDWERQFIGVPPDVNLLLPALFCSSVLFFISLVSAGMVSAGYGTWCSYVERGLEKEESSAHCSEAKDLYWTNDPEASNTYNYLEEAVAGSWILVIALGVKVVVCAVRVKQHFQVILKDEDDDLIDLYPDFYSYEVIQTPLPVTAPKRRQGTVTLPRDPPEYTPVEDRSSDEEDFEPLEPYEEQNKVEKDNLIHRASVTHPDTEPDGDSVDMSVLSDDAQTVKRRISRMDAISEDEAETSADVPETIEETDEQIPDDTVKSKAQ